MSKPIKLILLILSVIFCISGIYLYLTKPPVHLSEMESGGCRIFTTDYFQREKCYENALAMYLNYPEFRDTALVAFQDVCNQGESNACFAKDELRKESSLNFSPFQEHIDNGNLDALRCINKKQQPQDSIISDYYCSKASTYGKLVKDSYLISEIEQNWRPFEGQFYLDYLEHNFVFDDAYNEDLYKKNCSNIQSENQKKYCSKFNAVDLLRKKLFSAVYGTQKPNLNLINSLTTEVCQNFPTGCWILFNEADFNIQLFKQHNKYEKTEYLKNYASSLSLLQRMLIWTLINDQGLLKETTPHNLQDSILKLHFQHKEEDIKKICSSEKINKEGCFLGFNNFGEARNHPDLLHNYCSNKDPFSCKLIELIKYNRVLKIADSKPSKILYHNYRSFILKSYLDYPLRKFSLFLDRHRTTILGVSLALILVLQIFIIMLFKRSEDVFRFIRKQTIEKIQSKLNKRTDE